MHDFQGGDVIVFAGADEHGDRFLRDDDNRGVITNIYEEGECSGYEEDTIVYEVRGVVSGIELHLPEWDMELADEPLTIRGGGCPRQAVTV